MISKVFCGENSNTPSIGNGTTVKSDSYTNGDFTISIADLWNGITYYYRTYVKIADKVYYGDVMSFMTQNVIVTTGTVTNITGMSAKISGNVENIEALGAGYYEIGIAYSRNNTLDDCEFVLSEQSTNGDFSVTITNLSGAVTYYYCAYVKNDFEYYYGEVLSFTTKDEITSGQEVDLGLSVKWAGWNVGATSPEQDGGYYAWGETEEKSDYSVQTYKHYNDSIGYVNIGENISGTQYDVATAKWGNGWRMPTWAELEELYTRCSIETYRYKGVLGVKVIGPNGNAIFLPCAGYRGNTVFHGVGNYGVYWSGSLCNDNSYAWSLNVNGANFWSRTNRVCGLSVRPVRDY